MKFILQFFTWWNGQTLGTRFYTWRKGRKVGEDGQGNIYYHDKADQRRWVIYNGLAEPSRVPPEWHGWLHFTQAAPPGKDLELRDWQKPHKPNLTGTPDAYRPDGSLLKPGGRPPATGDYEAWTPE
jgi:NADH:ubiquinone oxidoreductase subunit